MNYSYIDLWLLTSLHQTLTFDLNASTSITDLWLEQLKCLFECQVQLPCVFHLELLEQLDSSLLVLYVRLHECPTKTVVQVTGFVGILEPSEILKLLLLMNFLQQYVFYLYKFYINQAIYFSEYWWIRRFTVRTSNLLKLFNGTDWNPIESRIT